MILAWVKNQRCWVNWAIAMWCLRSHADFGWIPLRIQPVWMPNMLKQTWGFSFAPNIFFVFFFPQLSGCICWAENFCTFWLLFFSKWDTPEQIIMLWQGETHQTIAHNHKDSEACWLTKHTSWSCISLVLHSAPPSPGNPSNQQVFLVPQII